MLADLLDFLRSLGRKTRELLSHLHISIAIPPSLGLFLSLPNTYTPLRVHSFVQGHANSIHLRNLTVEVCLEVTVCTEGFSNMPHQSMFGMKLNWLEIVDVI